MALYQNNQVTLHHKLTTLLAQMAGDTQDIVIQMIRLPLNGLLI
jgi:hypothetical protein